MAQSITLQTSDNDIIASDVLGRLSFAASSESSGSDAILIGASIYAMAESDFTAISNATSIIFATSSSESAAAKLKISSQGHFLPMLNKTYDIGASGTKFRNVYGENGEFENLSIENLSDPYEILYITDGGGSVGATDLLKVDSSNGKLDLNGDIVGTGDINISGNLTANSGNLDVISFNVNDESPLLKGQLSWDDTEGTLSLGLTDNSTIHFGEHRYFRIRNETGGTLYKGQVVYASGVHANGIIVPALYVADGTIREVRFMGVVLENVNNQNNGYVVDFGHIENMDLDGSATNYAVGDETWNAGDILYVHPTVAGKLTKNEPKHSISVAIVLDPGNGNGNGRMFVRPTSYGHLDDNHDVAVSGATNGQFLQYNSATDYWVPSSSGNFTTLQLNGTVVSISGHTHSSSDITDFNSSVSGLLPTISNSGDNRILTSTGSSVGINAESNLTFDGNLLNVVGSGSFSSNLNLSSQTVNTIAGFDGSKNIVSLPTSTYPSFTELSYVKGVTSSIQTQLNSKAPTASPAFTGAATFAGNVQINVTNALLDTAGNLRVFTTDSQAADKGGQIGLGGANGSAGSFDPWSFAVIKGAKENSTSGNLAGYVVFATASSGGVLGERLRISSTGTATFAGQVLVTAGSGSSGSYKPGVAISGDDDTGIQQVGGANTLSLVTDGTERVRVDASGNVGIGTSSPTCNIDLRVANTGALGPQLNLWNTGTFNNTNSCRIGFSTDSGGSTTTPNAAIDAVQVVGAGGGTELRFLAWNGSALETRVTVGHTGQLLVTAGSASAPGVAISGDTNTGIAQIGGADTLSLVASGAERLVVGPSNRTFVHGNGEQYGLGVRYVNTAGAVYFGATSNTSDPDAAISNAGGTTILLAKNNGEVIVGGTTDQGAYNLQCNGTGVWGAGAYVNGSDERIKDDITPLGEATSVIAAMQPVTFRYKATWSSDQNIQPGFVAQQLQEALAGTPYLDGVVQQGTEYLSVAYQSLIPLLVKALQESNARIAALEERLNHA